MRSAGPASLQFGMQRRFEHDAFFYESDEAFVESLVPFLRDGLSRGEAAAAATTRANIDRLCRALGRDADAVEFFDQQDWFVRPAMTVGGWERFLDRSLTRGVAFTRMVGEVGFGATPDRWVSWTRFESALNGVFRGAPTWIVCPYDTRVVPKMVLEDAWRTHPTVWDATRRPSDRYTEPEVLLTQLTEPVPAVEGAPVVDVALADGLEDVRALVRDATREHLPASRVEDLALMVSEVAGNALRYGGGRRRLAIWIGGDRVVCEVSDEGAGFTDQLAGYVPPKHKSMGMGLWIVRHMCDALTIDSTPNGTTVRFALDL